MPVKQFRDALGNGRPTLDPEGATLGEVVLDVDDEQRARHQLFDRLSPQLYMAVARVSWASLASSVMPSRIE